jgi:hypothetical protein
VTDKHPDDSARGTADDMSTSLLEPGEAQPPGDVHTAQQQLVNLPESQGFYRLFGKEKVDARSLTGSEVGFFGPVTQHILTKSDLDSIGSCI